MQIKSLERLLRGVGVGGLVGVGDCVGGSGAFPIEARTLVNSAKLEA